jgi:hypothetical protein
MDFALILSEDFSNYSMPVGLVGRLALATRASHPFVPCR